MFSFSASFTITTLLFDMCVAHSEHNFPLDFWTPDAGLKFLAQVSSIVLSHNCIWHLINLQLSWEVGLSSHTPHYRTNVSLEICVILLILTMFMCSLHCGQFWASRLCVSNHCSIQCAWNTCPHGSIFVSIVIKSSLHIEQSISVVTRGDRGGVLTCVQTSVLTNAAVCLQQHAHLNAIWRTRNNIWIARQEFSERHPEANKIMSRWQEQ